MASALFKLLDNEHKYLKKKNKTNSIYIYKYIKKN